MTPTTYQRLVLGLGAAGTAFAGYLSAVRMRSGMCAFDESCPFFLGRPACYFGFALFAGIFVVATAATLLRVRTAWSVVANLVLSSLGVAFATLMTAREVGAHTAYKLGLPTCVYGSVFFAAVLVASVLYAVRARAMRRRGGAASARAGAVATRETVSPSR
jgi:hypothetical protein